MKRIINIMLLAVMLPLKVYSQFACSGVDRVDVYIHNKLIGTATLASIPVIKLENSVQSDTIVFHAFTNFDGLRNSTVDVKDEGGELIDHVNSTGNTGYEAIYIYIFDKDNIDDASKALQVFLNLLCEREVETSQIATVRILWR